MKITSTAFDHNEMIPKKYTCDGDDVNPPLEFSAPPADLKSFVIIVRDRDAKGGDFVHWLVWNINPIVREIRAATVPVGAIEGMNDFGQISWNGPCPPSGTHHYEFHLYALDKMIDLPATSDKNDLREEIKESILEETLIVGLYKKD